MKMKYTAAINVSGDGALIQKAFAAEDTGINRKASYTLRKTAGGVAFSIRSDDSAGLRAMLNSITKVLTVIEKIENIRG